MLPACTVLVCVCYRFQERSKFTCYCAGFIAIFIYASSMHEVKAVVRIIDGTAVARQYYRLSIYITAREELIPFHKTRKSKASTESCSTNNKDRCRRQPFANSSRKSTSLHGVLSTLDLHFQIQIFFLYFQVPTQFHYGTNTVK